MRHTFARLVLLIAALALTTSAGAQNLIISDPRFDQDQRDCIVMTLELDEEQQDQFDELAAVYASEIAQIFSDIEAMGEEFEEEGFSVQRGIEIWEEVSERITARQDRLFEDLALFMSDEQAQRVARCRDRLRRMGITNGDLAGTLPGGFSMGMDPVVLAIDMGLPGGLDDDQRAAFDRALISYDNAMKGNIDDLLEDVLDLVAKSEAFQDNPMAGFMQLQNEIKKVVDGAKSLREDHQRLGFAIARTLPENKAQEWNDTFKRALYPGPYARIDSEVLLDRLLDQPALSDEEFATVIEISAELQRKAGSIRDEWTREIDDFLRDFKFDIMTMMSFNPDAIGEPFRERMRELDEQTIAGLRQRVDNQVVQDLMDAMLVNEAPDAFTATDGTVEIRIENEGSETEGNSRDDG
ncbi:MAG: hypothetical protein Tsb0013_21060 [Phycisphaerales bacterium]